MNDLPNGLLIMFSSGMGVWNISPKGMYWYSGAANRDTEPLCKTVEDIVEKLNMPLEDVIMMMLEYGPLA